VVVRTKLLRPPAAILATSTPLRAGSSNSLSQKRMLPSSRCDKSDPPSDAEDNDDCRVYGDDLAYGSRMDLGISSTDNPGGSDFVGDGLGTSNLRKPSWPYALAFLLTGWAKVRPLEVRARTWSFPAAMEMNLENSPSNSSRLDVKGVVLFSPSKLLLWHNFREIYRVTRSPERAERPPRSRWRWFARRCLLGPVGIKYEHLPGRGECKYACIRNL
jgi:hypothetical protein